MIEDTSFVIDVLHDDPAALAYLAVIESENRPEKVASITVLELYELSRNWTFPRNDSRRYSTCSILGRSSVPTKQ